LDNRFEDWERGNISIRFGKGNTIKNNTFKGSGGGIVVRGKDNKILDNEHTGNNNQSEALDYRPVTVECGTNNGEYAPAIDNTIANNTYKNCRGPCIVLGQEANRPRKPKDNTFNKNTVIAEDVDSTFLIIPDRIGDDEDKKKLRDKNKYRDNELRGRRARPGILEGVSGAFK
jgi:parallel beta-helix repeat protein